MDAGGARIAERRGCVGDALERVEVAQFVETVDQAERQDAGRSRGDDQQLLRHAQHVGAGAAFAVQREVAAAEHHRDDARRGARDPVHRLERARRFDDRDDTRAAGRGPGFILERGQQFVDRLDMRAAAHLRQHDAVHAGPHGRAQVRHQQVERAVGADQHVAAGGTQHRHGVGEAGAGVGLARERHAVLEVEDQRIGRAGRGFRDEAGDVGGDIEKRAPDWLGRGIHRCSRKIKVTFIFETDWCIRQDYR
ncbi:hypothetical protein BLA6860_06617 [Burkholderia lata]|nr:hypothetical protein BLA6860_06617 [Burkholderia lata]